MTDYTYCEDCDHVANRKVPLKYWQCIKFPNLGGLEFVAEKGRVTEPYMYCRGINGGACPLYQPLKGKL